MDAYTALSQWTPEDIAWAVVAVMGVYWLLFKD